MDIRPNFTRAVTSPELLAFSNYWVIPSRAMPGFNIRVWRTDGSSGPMPTSDRMFIAGQIWRKHVYINVRCQFSPHADTTYEIMVMTMPRILERRESEENARREALPRRAQP